MITLNSLIVRLFFICSPSTICRFVIAVIVDSINAVTRARLFTHVFQECLKAITPSVAHRYASSSVILIRNAILGIASLLHACPAIVFASSRADRVPVSQESARGKFLSKAAATSSLSVFEPRCWRDNCASAVANTTPCRLTALRKAKLLDNGEPTKTLSNKIRFVASANCLLNTAATGCISSNEIAGESDKLISAVALASPPSPTFLAVLAPANNSDFSKSLAGKVEKSHSIASALSALCLRKYKAVNDVNQGGVYVQ